MSLLRVLAIHRQERLEARQHGAAFSPGFLPTAMFACARSWCPYRFQGVVVCTRQRARSSSVSLPSVGGFLRTRIIGELVCELAHSTLET
jgi:hypothetical protein